MFTVQQCTHTRTLDLSSLLLPPLLQINISFHYCNSLLQTSKPNAEKNNHEPFEPYARAHNAKANARKTTHPTPESTTQK